MMSRLAATLVAVAMLSLAPGVSLADPASKAAVASAFAKLGAAKSYRTTIASGSRTITVDYVAPNKRHTTAAAMEAITIGDDTWVKVNGSWQHMPKMAAGMPGPMGAAGMSAPTKPPDVDITSLGPKQCQGHPAQGYQFADASGTKSTILVDAAGYPCKMDMTTASGTNTIQWSNWNGSISINPPS